MTREISIISILPMRTLRLSKVSDLSRVPLNKWLDQAWTQISLAPRPCLVTLIESTLTLSCGSTRRKNRGGPFLYWISNCSWTDSTECRLSKGDWGKRQINWDHHRVRLLLNRLAKHWGHGLNTARISNYSLVSFQWCIWISSSLTAPLMRRCEIHTCVRRWATGRWVKPIPEPQAIICSALHLSPRERGQKEGTGTASTPKLVLSPEQKCTKFPQNTVGGREVKAKEPRTASANRQEFSN